MGVFFCIMKKADRFKNVINYFEIHKPVAETELHYKTAYELIVAVILSAQCTDKRVNIITPAFFTKFPKCSNLALAEFDEVFALIRSCSYPNSKTNYLIGMARTLVEKFDEEVPSTREKLQQLPGIGRKSANVILSVVFNQPEMAVDTHIFRVSARIGLTENAKNPYETEKQLVEFIEKDKIPIAHHWLILHGRYTCVARKPKCKECGLTEYCHFFQKNNK